MTSDEITKENAGVIAVAQMAMPGNLEVVFSQRLHTSDYDMVMLLHTAISCDAAARTKPKAWSASLSKSSRTPDAGKQESSCVGWSLHPAPRRRGRTPPARQGGACAFDIIQKQLFEVRSIENGPDEDCDVLITISNYNTEPHKPEAKTSP